MNLHERRILRKAQKGDYIYAPTKVAELAIESLIHYGYLIAEGKNYVITDKGRVFDARELVDCRNCGGLGYLGEPANQGANCPACNGTGKNRY